MAKKDPSNVCKETEQTTETCCPHSKKSCEDKKPTPWPSPAEAADLLVEFAKDIKQAGLKAFEKYKSNRKNTDSSSSKKE